MTKALNCIIVLMVILPLTSCSLSGRHKTLSQVVPKKDVAIANYDLSTAVMGPGSIVKITDTKGIEYIGNILGCLPSSHQINPDVTIISSEQQSVLLEPKDFIRIERISSIGPELMNLSSLEMTFSSLQEESIDELRLQKSLIESLPVMNSVCRSWLRPGAYVVRSAVSIPRTQYSFKKYLGQKDILLSYQTLGKYVQLQKGTSYSVTNEGKLSVDGPHYIAVKELISLDDRVDNEAIENTLNTYRDLLK